MTDKTTIWQNALINAITDPKELIEILELDKALFEPMLAASKKFMLKVPRSFVAKMKKGDPNDPLLKQILPVAAELEEVPGYESDPLQEASVNPAPGLLHKYHGRVLLTLTGTCGVNCRYCFRRDFPYEKNNPGTTGWEKALTYIANDPTISEVILSGGDPLVSNDNMLNHFSTKLTLIPHIKRLRIHSRMPVVLPERITEDLVRAITRTKFKTILITHANHPHEIDGEMKSAMHLLSKAGITLLNQSVLLKDINDSASVLIQLSECLFDAGILPYYLHVLDKVKGSAHFDLDRARASELHWELVKQLPGFLVPKLVCEQPGAPAKISIFNREFCTV